jgi:carbon monoxide dehydrogenase subunit G
MLEKILIGVAGVVALFVAVVSRRPAAYRVERSIKVDAPADRVFGILNDLHSFAGVLVLFGSLWEQSDPHMQKTFDGPAAGVGQSFTWTGKEAGQGTMTIEESVPGQKVVIRIAFTKPMASLSTCVLTVAATPAGSLATWSMAGQHNFVGKAAGMFMNMDQMLGADIEKGLAQLKIVAERAA